MENPHDFTLVLLSSLGSRACSSSFWIQLLCWSSSSTCCWYGCFCIRTPPPHQHPIPGQAWVTCPLSSEVDHSRSGLIHIWKQMNPPRPVQSPSSALCSSSHPQLIQPTTAELSEYFCRLHRPQLYWKPQVYKVSTNGDDTVPFGAPVLYCPVSQIAVCLSGNH